MTTVKSKLYSGIRYSLFFFIAVIVSMAFTSCEEERDEQYNDLIGTWSYTGPDPEHGSMSTCSMTFRRDGSCIIEEDFPSYPEDSYTAVVSYTLVGDLSNGATATLHLWGSDADGYDYTSHLSARISGNQLILCALDGDGEGETLTLTRQK